MGYGAYGLFFVRITGLFIAVSLGLFTSSGAFAISEQSKKQKLRFTRLPNQTQLTQNSVGDIIQDKEGFIWVATLGGLHKFDGLSFKRMELEGQGSSLKTSGGETQQITSVFEDSNGFLWVGGGQGRVFKVDKVTSEITNLTLKLNPQAFDVKQAAVDTAKPFGGLTTAIIEDDYGRIWLGAQQGMAIYNPLTDITDTNPQFEGGPEFWGQVRVLANADNGNIWVGSEQGLYLIDYSARKVLKHYTHDSSNPYSIGGNKISALMVEQDYLWVGTVENGLSRLDLKSDRFRVYRSTPADANSLGSNFIRDVLRDHIGRLWIAMQAGGVALYQSENDNFQRFIKDKDDPFGLPNNNVWRLFQDNSNVLWFGTAGSGMVQIVPSTRKFEVLESIPYNKNSISDDFVWGFCFDEDGLLWIATLDGLNSYNVDTGQAEIFRPNPAAPGELRDNQLIAMASKDGTHVWVGNGNGQVWLFNIEDESFSPLSQPGFGQSFNSGRVWYLHVDKHQYLWIGTPSGTYRLSPEQQQQALAGTVDFTPIVNHIVRTIYEDEFGNYWLGTQNGGVVILDENLDRVQQLANDPMDEKSLSHNTVRSINVDASGDIWIGTHSGLNKMIRPKNQYIRNKFQHYYQADGLANDTVYSILSERNFLWLGTNHGLSKFDIDNGKFQNYDVNDGLPANEFNGGAAVIAPDNTLFFGGVDGITYFNPVDLVKNTIAPKVVISGVEVNNEPIGNPFSIAHITTLDLNYTQNNILFNFAALDFHQAQLNKLKYRLFPYQNQWEDSADGSIKYSSLPPGDYQFQVKGANNDGVWSDEIKTINVTISPPYWFHPVAFIFYAVVLLYLFYVYRKNEQAQKAHLEEIVTIRTRDLAQANQELAHSIENLEEAREAAEHANELKSTFLANMSHEIRTPLTAIIGFTEHALNPDENAAERKNYLQRVLRSGQHLLRLINEILDLSKIEAEKLELENEAIKLFELLADIESFSMAQAQEKGLKFNVFYQYPLPETFNGDLFRIRQVLYNLCSNAIKFTKEGKVSIFVRYLQKSGQLHFSIQDTGIGMSSEELKRLFQPFVQADSSITRQFGGSGLGLVISQKLVHLMSGDLTVESTKGVGSHFDVFIPGNTQTPDLVNEKPHYDRADHHKGAKIKQYVDASILVAEDNEDNQLLIKLLLKPFGVKVTVVDNGVFAVEAALLENFNLILMDIQMPVMGGVEAVQLMRNAGIECPIIALTANIMKEDIDKYLTCGFDNTLAKPIQNQHFFEAINRYLSKSKPAAGDSLDDLIQQLKSGDEFKKIKAGFKAGIPNIVNRFEHHLQNQDWDEIRQQAHSVKGSAASMGYAELTEQATNIEELVKSGDFDKANDAVKRFVLTCEQLLDEA